MIDFYLFILDSLIRTLTGHGGSGGRYPKFAGSTIITDSATYKYLETIQFFNTRSSEDKDVSSVLKVPEAEMPILVNKKTIFNQLITTKAISGKHISMEHFSGINFQQKNIDLLYNQIKAWTVKDDDKSMASKLILGVSLTSAGLSPFEIVAYVDRHGTNYTHFKEYIDKLPSDTISKHLTDIFENLIKLNSLACAMVWRCFFRWN